MTKLHSLLASAAILGLIAGPVSALNVGVDTGAEIGIENGKTNNPGDDTSVDVGGASATADTTVMADAEVSAEANEFVDDVVLSADGTTIGKVTGVTMNSAGMLKLMVDLDPAVENEIRNFSVTVAADAVADGTINLGWTAEELMATLNG